jgi:hypothetical protein
VNFIHLLKKQPVRDTLRGFFLLFFTCLASTSPAQELRIPETLAWQGIKSDGRSAGYLYFTDALSDSSGMLPLFTERVSVPGSHSAVACRLEKEAYRPCTPEENLLIARPGTIGHEIIPVITMGLERKQAMAMVSFVPLRRMNNITGYEKLVSFELVVVTSEGNEGAPAAPSYAEHSALATGDWYRLKLDSSGIYRITRDDLLAYGLDPSAIDPRNIRIYGNGGQMLPEANFAERQDDLCENAIYVAGEDDGVFDPQDYILFYGNGPGYWYYNSFLQGYFEHKQNYYSDSSCYFLTASLGPGKRIASVASLQEIPDYFVTTFNDFTIHENDSVNLIRSGKVWLGEKFGDVLSYDLDFSLPGLDTSKTIIMRLEFAGRMDSSSWMRFYFNGQFKDSVLITPVQYGSNVYYRIKKKTIETLFPAETLRITLEFDPSTPTSAAWLNYLTVNYRRQLRFGGGQLLFRDINSLGYDKKAKFILGNSSGGIQIWDVTDFLDPVNILADFNGSDITTFIRESADLREYIAFDGTYFRSPVFGGRVANQDLHATGPFDFVIISHPLFLEQANRLAAIHNLHDNMTVTVVTPALIYNEFSSGIQDVSALRDYVRMLYTRFPGQEPRYLLLFGDGSHDPKDRLQNNTNFIPTFQTGNSNELASSMVIDDYFGFLDESEGYEAQGILDIGIGRLPVKTPQEARAVVDKIEHYLLMTPETSGSWRNSICVLADDEDQNTHLEQAEAICARLDTTNTAINVNKIYLDAYKQVPTPGGSRYPEVNEDIRKQIEQGALVMDYIGHGGELGWAQEQILNIGDIMKWRNLDRLPAFFTATCEFSRFDDPGITSAGELVLLNDSGGGIALFTTTRLAYSMSNFALNDRFYEYFWQKIDGGYPRMGDLVRLSKPPQDNTVRNFVLLGDPALRICYPDYNVEVEEMNNVYVHDVQYADTLRALDEVILSGTVQDSSGYRVSGFTGKLDLVLYDKRSLYLTQENDPGLSAMVSFTEQDRIITRQKVSVNDGNFSCTFVVPRDIAYGYGPGKMSFYAASDNEDANGSFAEFLVGGIGANPPPDNAGPVIRLLINDTLFVEGGITNKDPLLIALLSDEHGINLSESGLGHQIVAWLDEDYANPIVMNDFFIPETDNYKAGSLTYPFHDLADGLHTLTLKAWDVYNNPSEATISFLINYKTPVATTGVFNFPNPFRDRTTFTFMHNKPGQQLDILLEIFDFSGKPVLTHRATLSSMQKTDFFTWDGSSGGNRLRQGLYLYTLTITDPEGNVSKHTQKMVMLK